MCRPILLALAVAICCLDRVSASGKLPKLTLKPDHFKGETLIWPDWSNQTVSCCTYKRWQSVILLKENSDGCWELLGEEQNEDCHACVTYNVPTASEADNGRYLCLLVSKDDYFNVNVEPKPTDLPTGEPQTTMCSATVDADIVFALDSSGSVADDDFIHGLSFLQDIVSSLGTGGNQYGMITFASLVKLQFYLNAHSTVAAVNADIADTVVNTIGSTNTHKALQFIRKDMFDPSNGARPDPVEQIAIIITDGKSTKPQKTIEQAEKLLAEQVRVFAIGVGMPNTGELETIAGNSSRVFTVAEFSALDTILNDIANELCDMMSLE